MMWSKWKIKPFLFSKPYNGSILTYTIATPELTAQGFLHLFSCLSWLHPLSQLPWPSSCSSRLCACFLPRACSSCLPTFLPEISRDPSVTSTLRSLLKCHLLIQNFSDLTIEKNTPVPPLCVACPISLPALFPLELYMYILFLYLACCLSALNTNSMVLRISVCFVHCCIPST